MKAHKIVRLIYCLAAILLLALASGCASNTKKTSFFDGQGALTHTVETDMTDSATYHEEQAQLKLAAIKNRKPIAEIVIPDGTTLMAEGGDITIRVWGNQEPGAAALDQYREPWLEGIEKGGPYGLLGAWIYGMGWGPNNDPSKQTGNNYIDGSFNNTDSSGSATGWMPGAGRDVTLSPGYQYYPSTTSTITGAE